MAPLYASFCLTDALAVAVALFVFDILYLNGESLLDRSFDERRALLEQHLTVVPRHVLLAELHKPKDGKWAACTVLELDV